MAAMLSFVLRSAGERRRADAGGQQHAEASLRWSSRSGSHTSIEQRRVPDVPRFREALLVRRCQ